jgi:hypothetical protein
MTKQEFIDEKKRKISELTEGQEKICKDIEALAKRPYVDFETSVKNATQIVQWTVMARSLEMQKQMIAAQKMPSYIKGGVVPGGLAIVGEGIAKEIIVSP